MNSLHNIDRTVGESVCECILRLLPVLLRAGASTNQPRTPGTHRHSPATTIATVPRDSRVVNTGTVRYILTILPVYPASLRDKLNLSKEIMIAVTTRH